MQHANCILNCIVARFCATAEWTVLDDNCTSLLIIHSPQLNDWCYARCLDRIVEHIERSEVVHGRVGTPSYDRAHVICGASQHNPCCQLKLQCMNCIFPEIEIETVNSLLLQYL